MCIGIPMQVMECNGMMAKCRGRGETRNLSLALLGEQAPGTWVLTSLAMAREVLDEETAMRINSALDGAEGIMRENMDMSEFFPDLVGREPELPDFLKGNKS
ncbi:MAG: HypC/HybG/HupF family hydrogenase formation chaperone [Burkholderiales bacterium]